MNDDIKDSEAWILRQAERLSKVMRDDPTYDHVPAYAKSVSALAVVMAGAFHQPCYRILAERVQIEHRTREHGGGRTSECEACGWFDGAVYKATTGREFLDDFPELLSSSDLRKWWDATH